MKRTLFFFAFLFVMSIVISCANREGTLSQKENTLQKVMTSKELHVGYFIFEPTIMKDPKTDSLKGVFIDMITKIAKAINPETKIVYHQTTLSTFHTELNSGQFDICIGATFATPKRASVVTFTHPLFYCGYTGVTKKENATKFTTWKSIDNAEVTTAVLQGSAIADVVNNTFVNKKSIKSFPGADVTIPLAAVSSNQADVGLMNQVTVFTFLREHPELVEVMANEPIATTYFSWAVKQDDIVWLNYLNTCIDYMINSGEMEKFERKYNVPLMHSKTEYYYPISK